MSREFFDARIQLAIDHRRELAAKGGYRFDEREPGRHTYGDLIVAVFTIDTEADARAFFAGYVAYLDAVNAEGEGAGQGENIAAANVGYCYGEGMAPERIAMWHHATGASHSVFGTVMPSMGEAFSIGKRLGEQAGP